MELVELFRMITSEHHILQISFYLAYYKHFVREQKKGWPFAKAITIDWTWVGIHSITETWNGKDINEYLEKMYKYCKNPSRNPPKDFILIKICYAHFMQIVSRTIRRRK